MPYSAARRAAESGLHTTTFGPLVRYVGTLPVAGHGNLVVRSG